MVMMNQLMSAMLLPLREPQPNTLQEPALCQRTSSGDTCPSAQSIHARPQATQGQDRAAAGATPMDAWGPGRKAGWKGTHV